MENNINQKFDLQDKLDISSPEKFIKNTDHFNSLMMRYRCAIREIRTKLEVLNDEFSIKYNRNPISSIKSRIKTPLSIYNKLQRLGYDFTEQNIKEQLNDVAGIRVICSFIDDIYIMAKLLSDQDDITVLRIKDYIQNPKDNGYRSYHMIVEIPVFFAEGKTPMRAEIQIRTIAMDFWASLEHQIKYKRSIPGQQEVADRLRGCADVIARTDEEMLALRQKIEKAEDLPSEEEELFEKLRKLDIQIV